MYQNDNYFQNIRPDIICVSSECPYYKGISGRVNHVGHQRNCYVSINNYNYTNNAFNNSAIHNHIHEYKYQYQYGPYNANNNGTQNYVHPGRNSNTDTSNYMDNLNTKVSIINNILANQLYHLRRQ